MRISDWSSDVCSSDLGQAQDYIDQQVRIADMELQRQLRTDAFNDSLRYQADLLDAMANNVSIAARGMADAFGEAGKALGDLASSFAGYMADQDHLKSVRDEQLRQAAPLEKTEERAQQEGKEAAEKR